ncbi:MAG: hypothetical protein KDB87_03405, partial [Flavobacteriales bacterium]|nr:hypothetical protein [Flavobacteriales bacterium]
MATGVQDKVTGYSLAAVNAEQLLEGTCAWTAVEAVRIKEKAHMHHGASRPLVPDRTMTVVF